MINFHDARQLSKIIQSYNVSPRVPTRLSVLPPSVLLYDDVSKVPHEVHWLDCSGSVIKPADDLHVTQTRQRFTHDMCCTKIGDKTLLVTTSGFGGTMQAYNAANNNVEWVVEGRLPGMRVPMKPHGITTDGQGHLFVCDSASKCVQMFGIDSEYMGSVLREETQPFDQLCAIWWSLAASSLILVHRNKDSCSISTIKDVTGASQLAIEEAVVIEEEDDAGEQQDGITEETQVPETEAPATQTPHVLDRLGPAVHRVEPEAGTLEPEEAILEPEEGILEPEEATLEPEVGTLEPEEGTLVAGDQRSSSRDVTVMEDASTLEITVDFTGEAYSGTHNLF